MAGRRKVGLAHPRASVDARKQRLQSSDRDRDDEPRLRLHAAPTVSLAAVFPELLEGVPAKERPVAARALVARLLSGRDEELGDVMRQRAPGALDFLIVEGVVLKQTVLDGRAALELLGPGDVLAPHLSAARKLDSRAVSRYLAHGSVSLAALEGGFRKAARVWPGIADFLLDRLRRETDRASMHVAMLHQPRVEDRLIVLFSDLAERFGCVAQDGVLIDLPMTHEVIGGLVASRRPTVSLALNQLASGGLLKRLADNRWLLARDFVSR